MRLNKNIKFFLKYVLGPLLFVWLSWSIYREIRQQPNLALSWQQIKTSLKSPEIGKLIAAIGLMVVNWSIETRKWQLAVRRVQKISFWQGFKAILTGVSFSVTTPNRTGEYLGRVLYMEEGNRLRTISLTILCSMSQLLVTLFAGIIGLLFLWDRILRAEPISGWSSIGLQVLLFGSILALIILTLFYFRVSLFARWIDRLSRKEKFAFLLVELGALNATILWRLLSLSTIRFGVFILQYYLLFSFFGVEVGFVETLWSTSLVFLILAIIPGFALADLGIRGEVNLKVLGLYSSNAIGIGFTAVIVWFINLIIPALAGSLLILGIKFFSKRPSKQEGT